MSKSQKICIIIQGAQCTGKSTLLFKLKQQYHQANFIYQIARQVIIKQKLTNYQLQNNIQNCFQKLQEKIFISQYQHQINKIKENPNVIILDRCVISPLVYSKFYFPKNSQLHQRIQNSKQFQQRMKYYKNQGVIFLLHPQQSILKQDGVRKEATFIQLQRITQIYKQIIQKYKIRCCQIEQLEYRTQIIQAVLLQANILSTLQLQQLKTKQNVKILKENNQIQIKQENIKNNQEKLQQFLLDAHSFGQNIPVLFKRKINQNLYKKEDFQFQVNLSSYQWNVKKNKNNQYLVIKKLYIKSQQLILSYQKKPKNRIMAIIGSQSQDNFLFITFQNYQTDRKYAKICLNSSIIINNQCYNFFGYSKSNLRQFSCYFYKSQPQNIVNILNSFGDFNQIYSISKKASKLSLLYSSSNFICSLLNQKIKIIKDVYKNNECFTDGCGYISLSLARKIKKQIGNLEYLPSVYQIRIKGIKGILIINPQNQNQQQILVRQSMIKFNAKKDKLNQLVLVNYSKPTNCAAINQQIIMLLSGLGIPDKYFLEIQQKYIKLLKQACLDPVKAIQLLKFLGKQEIINQIFQNKQDILFKFKTIISQQIFRNIKTKDLRNKLRIPLQNARFLYGAVYPQIKLKNQQKKRLSLKQNQIFLRVTTNKGVIQTIIGKVIVTKNPCYYTGDIRILQAVDITGEFPFAKKLIDVIIFSTEGNLPISSTIAGSDYDGDQYFVSWDQNLIPKRYVQPYRYPKVQLIEKNKNYRKVTQNDLIDHFVYFDRSIVGKINNRFLSFATISPQGVNCQECIQLGTQLFSRAIDSVSTGQKILIPDNLKYPNKQQFINTHIWVKMTQIYNNFLQTQFKFDNQIISNWNISYDMMLSIIQEYISTKTYNDYHLFKIIKSWFIVKKIKNIKYYGLFKYVNFAQLTKQQKSQIKQLQNFPLEYLGNPFDMSLIFSNLQFKKNGINFHSYEDTYRKWRKYYRAQGNEINFQIFEQALIKFNHILIGISVNQQVNLVFRIQNMKKIPYYQNIIPYQSFKAYYLGYNQLKVMHIQQKQYKLFYSDQLFQIYQKQRRNSFFWFKNNKVSIDLTRFDRKMLNKHPKINKQTIFEFQIYVGLSQNYKVQQIKKLYVNKPIQKIQNGFQMKNEKKNQKKKKYVQKK